MAPRMWPSSNGFRPRARPRLGDLGIGAPLGSMIGFPLVILLVANYGWRASFYVLAALNILVVLPAVWFLVRDKPQAADTAISGAEAMPFSEAIRLLVSNKLFWLLALYDCSAMVYLWGLNSWLPTYLQVARHFDIKHSSVFSSLPFLLMIGGYFLGGWLGDKWRIKAWLCMVGMIGAGLLVYAASVVANPTNSALLIALSAGSWGSPSRHCSRWVLKSSRPRSRRWASASMPALPTSSVR